MDIMDEIHQQINQLNSEMGWPAVTDFKDLDEIAENMERVSRARMSPLDRNEMAQDLISEWMQELIRPSDGREIEMDLRWYPKYDERDIFTARLFGVARMSPNGELVKVPLMDGHGQWRKVGVAYLNSQTRCQAKLQRQCHALSDDSMAVDPRDLQCYPIKRGEYIFIVWMCEGCRERLEDPKALVDIQTEPQRWRDTGPRSDDGDPFDGPNFEKPTFGNGWFDDPNWD
ncbi:hypothetical protein PDG61_08745 [Mycolicibacterium sp. BiH015]|uniref:hypothetical protein n=1 Tax=Mycolicibacterium sp. BiH015 TaxID=3018808 RepID=UPI0022E40D05|nr:hypothetical protein [Mycolicibacterium sp. BiH015]MDA2890996.1 hypothetical protein [Mycolicibacterium sp. BiH015]